MKEAVTKFFIIVLSITLIPVMTVGKAKTTEQNSKSFTVFDVSSKKIITLTPREYLIGALFAEIDPSYSIEALKAQTVICYTNALFSKQNSKSSYDFEIDISQSTLYLDEKAAKKKYGENYDSLREKISSVVDLVYEKAITYESNLVLLPYFACSNGITEDAKNVWGQSIEYLRAVESPGDVLNPNLKSVYTFSLEMVRQIVKEKYNLDLPENLAESISIKSRSESETVTTCELGSLTMTGQNFRALFGLCSANFDLVLEESELKIICYGSGHCVGMSQYGADFMARQGSSYIEILEHYYKGIEIS